MYDLDCGGPDVVLVESFRTNRLRSHVMTAQWSYIVWSVVHVLPVGAEPPTTSPFGHPCTVGVNRNPRVCVMMSRVTS